MGHQFSIIPYIMLDVLINNDMNINTHIDIPPPQPRLQTVPVWGGGWVGWYQYSYIDIDKSIDIHISIHMNRPQAPLRRPAGLFSFLFRHAFLKKGPFCECLTFVDNNLVMLVNHCSYSSVYCTAYVPTCYTVLRTYIPSLRTHLPELFYRQSIEDRPPP